MMIGQNGSPKTASSGCKLTRPRLSGAVSTAGACDTPAHSWRRFRKPRSSQEIPRATTRESCPSVYRRSRRGGRHSLPVLLSVLNSQLRFPWGRFQRSSLVQFNFGFSQLETLERTKCPWVSSFNRYKSPRRFSLHLKTGFVRSKCQSGVKFVAKLGQYYAY